MKSLISPVRNRTVSTTRVRGISPPNLYQFPVLRPVTLNSPSDDTQRFLRKDENSYILLQGRRQRRKLVTIIQMYTTDLDVVGRTLVLHYADFRFWCLVFLSFLDLETTKVTR